MADYQFYGSRGEGKLIGLGELRNLGWLHLRNIHHTKCVEEIGRLTLLEVLWLENDSYLDSRGSFGREGLSPPNLDKCIHLRELVLRDKCLKAFPDLSRLRSLRKVIFEESSSAKEVLGLISQMSALQELLLIKCTSLCHIPGMGDLVSLRELCVAECSKLLELPSFYKLTNLQRLVIRGKFHKVQGFSKAMVLQELIVHGVVHLPDLHLLRNLQRLDIQSFLGSMVPQFGSFTALEELSINRMPEVQELLDMHKLSMLRRLDIFDAGKLELQPLMFGNLVALEELRLYNCGSMVGKAEILDLHCLTNLQVLILGGSPIRSFPRLECLTLLRHLFCGETQLAELPDLTNLKLLESISLYGCHELTSLGNLGNLPTLKSINLSGCHELTNVENLENIPSLEYLKFAGCYRVERLPDFRNFKKLKSVTLCYSGIRLSSKDTMVLAALLHSRVFICDHFQLNFLKMLEKMPMTEVVMKIEAKQMEFFARAPTRDSYINDRCMHFL